MVSAYQFSVLDYAKIGDQYNYKVHATDRIAAQRALIAYFFGRAQGEAERKYRIKSDHNHVSWPAHSGIEAPNDNIFGGKGGVRFARLISGQPTPEDWTWLRARAHELGVDINR